MVWIVEKRRIVPVQGKKLFEGSSAQRRSSIAWPYIMVKTESPNLRRVTCCLRFFR